MLRSIIATGRNDRPRSRAGRRRHVTVALLALAFLNACATLPPPPQPCVIAVWDLENASPTDTPGTAAPITPALGGLLASEIISTIAAAPDCTVVERQRLLLVLEELSLGSSDLAQTGTRLEVGRLLGAHEMIFGGYQVIGPTMRLDLRRVAVASGRILAAASHTAPATDINAWITAARRAAAELMVPRE